MVKAQEDQSARFPDPVPGHFPLVQAGILPEYFPGIRFLGNAGQLAIAVRSAGNAGSDDCQPQSAPWCFAGFADHRDQLAAWQGLVRLVLSGRNGPGLDPDPELEEAVTSHS